MTETIAKASHIPPRDAWAKLRTLLAEPIRGFTDPEQGIFHGVGRPIVFLEGCWSIPRVKYSTLEISARMLLNSFDGSPLKGTDRLAVDFLPHMRPQRSFHQQIHPRPQQVRNLVLDMDHVE